MIDGFLLKKLISVFVHLIPGAFFLLLLTLIGRRWWPRVCNSLSIIICTILIAGSIPPISNYFVSNLEDRNAVLQTAPEDTAIILVLGAGQRYAADRPPNSVLAAAGLSRLMEGVRLWKTKPDALLAVSGANFNSPVSQAEIFKRMAVESGVPATQILVFDQSMDTSDEIDTVSQTLVGLADNGNQNKHLVVVSSALHLPRVELMIEDYDLSYSLAPTDFRAVDRPWYLPASGYLYSLDRAIHEWVGMIWYHLKTVSGR